MGAVRDIRRGVTSGVGEVCDYYKSKNRIRVDTRSVGPEDHAEVQTHRPARRSSGAGGT